MNIQAESLRWTRSHLTATRVPFDPCLGSMLMMIAQLLEAACEMNATLLLPMLAADPLSGRRLIKKHALPFSAVFDVPHFESALASCAATLGDARSGGPNMTTADAADAPFAICSRVAASLPLPPMSVQTAIHGWSDARRREYHERRVKWVSPALINRSWSHSHGLVTCVYRASRPSQVVSAIVRQLEREARARVGARYVAIHLPIERDWWWESNFCKPRANDYPRPHARRCFTPAEVAHRTARVRTRLGASGALLLYAQDKVGATRHPYAGSPGPAVCADDFGGAATVQKLALPAAKLNYTLRNAAEQWLAARAPVAFFGNSHSTFSQGVALMRGASPSGSARGRSFAYDCVASREAASWASHTSPALRMAHPGFWHLSPLPDAQERCHEDDWGELARAERWWRRGEPPLV